MAVTGLGGGAKLMSGRPVAVLHVAIPSVVLAQTAVRPSGLKARHVSHVDASFRVLRGRPVPASQRVTVPSGLPVTSVRPSGLSAGTSGQQPVVVWHVGGKGSERATGGL
jgi:hypothetical protein